MLGYCKTQFSFSQHGLGGAGFCGCALHIHHTHVRNNCGCISRTAHRLGPRLSLREIKLKLNKKLEIMRMNLFGPAFTIDDFKIKGFVISWNLSKHTSVLLVAQFSTGNELFDPILLIKFLYKTFRPSFKFYYASLIWITIIKWVGWYI